MKPQNHLSGETSPYLLQHANNPVDWYPWCDEAFEKAAREGKPIFLSIGYSSCHWCHVMEKESFKDADIAKILNDGFVTIKVDREERPDVDAVYMRACQMLTGAGGWPLTIFMTHERRPFFAATYLPKLNSYGRVGLMELLPRIRDMWMVRSDDLATSAAEITARLAAGPTGANDIELGEGDMAQAFESFRAAFDARYGGFGMAPKFPTSHNLTFLMRYHRRTGDERALQIVETTLEHLYMGGIHDHVGGGFHRYSTDAEWRVPHFEKMLYDQALNSMAYVDAWQLTRRADFRRVAQSTLDYAIRDLLSPQGGFMTAEDADSGGGEGSYYTWTMRDLRKALGGEDMKLLQTVFDVREGGNATGLSREGANVLYMRAPLDALTGTHAIDPDDFAMSVVRALGKLFEARRARSRPARDGKILADLNGLMIAALAVASRAFGNSEYLRVAKGAADYVLGKLMRDGRLIHGVRGEGEPIGAFADDYAFFVWGLIELYQAGFDARYLSSAIDLSGTLVAEHWDPALGLTTAAEGASDLPVRVSESIDGATPSANSVHVRNLLLLSRATGEKFYERQAQEIMRAFAAQVREAPSGHTFFLGALDCALGPPLDVIVTGDPDSNETARMLSSLRRTFAPDMMLLFRDASREGSEIESLSGFVKECEPVDGKTTAYVCRGRACLPPTTDPEVALAAVEAKG